MAKVSPNTTQVPNVILDDWMPKLKDTELRVLLVVIRQTLGWIEDKKTGKRKEKDWISRGQLMKKAGRGHTAIAKAVEELTKKRLIEALDGQGNRLETPQDRQKHGERIYYRFNTFKPPASLFETTFPQSGKGKSRGNLSTKRKGVSTFQPPQKVDTTKETVITKYNILQPKNSAAGDKQKSPEISGNKNSKNEEKPQKPQERKPPSPHKVFIDFWHAQVKRARHIEKPIITGQDAKNLQRILKLGISETTLEKLSVYFLNHYSYKKFAPNISTFLSSGILNGLQNSMANDPDFWKNLSSYEVAETKLTADEDIAQRSRIRQELNKLRANLTAKLSSA